MNENWDPEQPIPGMVLALPCSHLTRSPRSLDSLGLCHGGRVMVGRGADGARWERGGQRGGHAHGGLLA
eukprot:3139118-Rhodomonas_salina.1